MRVRSKDDNREYEATKKDDSSYSVQGVVYTREEMAEKFIPIKEAKKEVVKMSIPAPKVEIHGGDKIPSLFEAVAKASGQMTNLNKGKEAFNYKYITLGQVIDMTRKPLDDNGLAVMNFPSTYIVDDQLIARVEVIVSHKDGAYISSVFDVPVSENKKQALVQSVATVHSYCVRYHRVNLLGIAGEDDTDGR